MTTTIFKDIKNNLFLIEPVTKSDKVNLNNQKPGVIWFTGLSGSGKSTLAYALELRMLTLGYGCSVLDGDKLRMGLCKDLGFSDRDRSENIRRLSEVSRLFVDAGLIIITAFISPFRLDRLKARQLFQRDEFVEVYLNTPIHVCEYRDPKGLYIRARKGKISHFTGIDSKYEAPQNPDLVINTSDHTVEECVTDLLNYLTSNGFIDNVMT